MTHESDNYLAASRFLNENKMNPREWTNLMVVGEAIARGYRLSVDHSRARVVIHSKGQSHWWKSGLTSLNSPLLMRITKNKDVTSRLLRAQGLPAVENAVFQEGEAERAWGWAQGLGALVLKPSDGTWGDDVHVGLDTWADFEAVFNDVVTRHPNVIVEPRVSGTEYRFVAVRDEVVAVTEMQPANVMGDGRASITDLVKRKNTERARSPIHQQLHLGRQELALLKQAGMGPEHIPDEGERVLLRRTTNLQTMGDAVDATDTVAEEHKDVIARAAKALPRGVLLGFDVLIDETLPQPVQILEVNSGPMISIQHLPLSGAPRDVAGAILNAMFPKAAHPPRDPSELIVPVSEIFGEHQPSFPKLRRIARRVRNLSR